MYSGAKELTIHVRFNDALYEKVLNEAKRLGMSRTDAVRHIVLMYFEMKDIKKDEGGGA